MGEESKMGPIGSEQIASIFPTAKKVITDPKGFFTDMPRRGGFVDPLIFLVAMGVVVGAIQAILAIVGLGSGVTVFMALFYIILVPIVFVIIGVVASFVLYCIWNVMGSREIFETAFRCYAYCAAISPITTIISLIPYVGSVLGLAWTMYLLIVASIEVHNIEPKWAWIVFGAIWAVFTLAVVCL